MKTQDALVPPESQGGTRPPRIRDACLRQSQDARRRGPHRQGERPQQPYAVGDDARPCGRRAVKATGRRRRGRARRSRSTNNSSPGTWPTHTISSSAITGAAINASDGVRANSAAPASTSVPTRARRAAGTGRGVIARESLADQVSVELRLRRGHGDHRCRHEVEHRWTSGCPTRRRSRRPWRRRNRGRP